MLLGSFPGADQEIAVDLRATFEVPELPQFPTVLATGGGPLAYRLSGPVARLFGKQIPQLEGTLDIGQEAGPARVVVSGLHDSTVEVRWGKGQDVVVEGLGLRGRVYPHGARQPIADLRVAQIRLTTGVITVAGRTVRGEIDIAKQRVYLVGTFPMPRTGIRTIDMHAEGRPVLIRLRVSPQAMQ